MISICLFVCLFQSFDSKCRQNHNRWSANDSNRLQRNVFSNQANHHQPSNKKFEEKGIFFGWTDVQSYWTETGCCWCVCLCRSVAAFDGKEKTFRAIRKCYRIREMEMDGQERIKSIYNHINILVIGMFTLDKLNDRRTSTNQPASQPTNQPISQTASQPASNKPRQHQSSTSKW